MSLLERKDIEGVQDLDLGREIATDEGTEGEGKKCLILADLHLIQVQIHLQEIQGQDRGSDRGPVLRHRCLLVHLHRYF